MDNVSLQVTCKSLDRFKDRLSKQTGIYLCWWIVSSAKIIPSERLCMKEWNKNGYQHQEDLLLLKGKTLPQLQPTIWKIVQQSAQLWFAALRGSGGSGFVGWCGRVLVPIWRWHTPSLLWGTLGLCRDIIWVCCQAFGICLSASLGKVEWKCFTYCIPFYDSWYILQYSSSAYYQVVIINQRKVYEILSSNYVQCNIPNLKLYCS